MPTSYGSIVVCSKCGCVYDADEDELVCPYCENEEILCDIPDCEDCAYSAHCSQYQLFN